MRLEDRAWVQQYLALDLYQRAQYLSNLDLNQVLAVRAMIDQYNAKCLVETMEAVENFGDDVMDLSQAQTYLNQFRLGKKS